jgi:hypothetical protein
MGAHGSLRRETGQYTAPAAGAHELQLKLKRVIWFKMQSLGSINETSQTLWVNSTTASAVQNDPGVVHVASGFQGNGVYVYVAVGKG